MLKTLGGSISMLETQKVDTEGCILVGYDSYKENRIGRSSNAYTPIQENVETNSRW